MLSDGQKYNVWCEATHDGALKEPWVEFARNDNQECWLEQALWKIQQERTRELKEEYR